MEDLIKRVQNGLRGASNFAQSLVGMSVAGMTMELMGPVFKIFCESLYLCMGSVGCINEAIGLLHLTHNITLIRDRAEKVPKQIYGAFSRECSLRTLYSCKHVTFRHADEVTPQTTEAMATYLECSLKGKTPGVAYPGPLADLVTQWKQACENERTFIHLLSDALYATKDPINEDRLRWMVLFVSTTAVLNLMAEQDTSAEFAGLCFGMVHVSLKHAMKDFSVRVQSGEDLTHETTVLKYLSLSLVPWISRMEDLFPEEKKECVLRIRGLFPEIDV